MNREIFEILAKYDDKKLWPYQLDTKRKIYDLYKENRSILLQMPTGTGKTRLFVSILRDFHDYIFNQEDGSRKPIRTLVLVHRVELLDQVYDTLGRHYGLGCSVIHSGERAHKSSIIQIASVQTLSKRLNDWRDYDFDFIIVDEAHHVPAKSYRTILDTFPNAFVLGVTATPYRLKGEGFAQIFDTLLVSQSVNDFIRNGFLSKYKYYSVAPYSNIQLMIDSIKKFNPEGDYDESELMKICNTDSIRAQIVDTYEKYAKGKKGIVYTINQLHNQKLCENFRAKGYNVAAIDSKTPATVRQKTVEDFRNGKIDIIFNVNIFSEGFDCPDIDFIQLARPTKSLSLYLQQVGRGLRVAEKKTECLFLDNVGLYNKFGFPSTPHNWNLYFYGGDVVENPRPGKRLNDGPLYKGQSLEEGYEKVHLIDIEDGHSLNTFDKKTFYILNRLLDYWRDFIEYVDQTAKEYRNDNHEPCIMVDIKNFRPIVEWKSEDNAEWIKELKNRVSLDFYSDRLYQNLIYCGIITKQDNQIIVNTLPFGEKYVKPILDNKISGTDLFKIRNFLCCYIDEDLYHAVNIAVSYGEDLGSYNDFLFKWLVEIYSTVPQLINHEYSMALPIDIFDSFMEVFGSLYDMYNVKSIYNTYRKKKSVQDMELGIN